MTGHYFKKHGPQIAMHRDFVYKKDSTVIRVNYVVNQAKKQRSLNILEVYL